MNTKKGNFCAVYYPREKKHRDTFYLRNYHNQPEYDVVLDAEKKDIKPYPLFIEPTGPGILEEAAINVKHLSGVTMHPLFLKPEH